jgi:phosphatidylserine decarboxylase
MATTQLPPTRTPSPITSIQPGGGLCFSLERLWGRFRRACLRTFRPGYVARMAALRQGECPGCPHDVLDPRDLKLVRNVCGYWFRPENDPFAWRGRLRLARAGLAELVCFSALFLILAVAFGLAAWLAHPLFLVGVAAVLALWAFVVSFFRDPERIPPAAPDLLLCAADGTITHVEEVPSPDFPGGRALRVSTFLSVFNVHVNRVPRTGRVRAVRYYPGRFHDARNKECVDENEQLVVDIEDERTGALVRTTQIAGAIARRIVCWLEEGEQVRAGDRFGMIKFGSRTDILVPADAVAEVLVRPGDKVKGASGALLRLKRN